jgi:UDP-2-acetamido-2-deoxy-ribo-hexuluronate aminotransferase
MGPEVAQREEKIAAFCGRKYGAGVSSGTDAFYLSLRPSG